MVRVEKMIRVPDCVRDREGYNFGLFYVVPLPPPPSSNLNHSTIDAVSTLSLSLQPQWESDHRCWCEGHCFGLEGKQDSDTSRVSLTLAVVRGVVWGWLGYQ